MNILFATSEAAPFCKTGGLGDVCGALPIELEKLGQRPAVILPAYRQAMASGMPIEPTGVTFQAPVGNKLVGGEFLRSVLPGSGVPVYLVKQDHYYHRDDLYRQGDQDYDDNCERFVFFARAVLEAILKLDLRPDVLHCHDWQAGLLPAYLKTLYSKRAAFQDIATLFTVHNLAYQGSFWHWDMELTGIGWEYFTLNHMEFYGRLNFMKTALSFADVINTVSPRYAKEIQSPPASCGLEGVLRHRSEDLYGVLNGVDYTAWDPATDPYIAANYDVESYQHGKAVCKAALQSEVGLPQRAGIPLIATVGRLADQKGFDLIAEVLPRWAQQIDVQWVLLGTGDQRYHELLAGLQREFPERVAVRLGFSNELAHRIEAGADLFLMPSRYEPCGLNQLYSLKYGAVPVVRETGGLADTITNCTVESLARGDANGFSFVESTPQALSEAIDRGCRAYQNPDTWDQLVKNGMRQDWSWTRSAGVYEELYERAVAKLAKPVAVE